MRLGVLLALLATLFGCSSDHSTAAPPAPRAASAEKPVDQATDAKAIIKRLAEFYRQQKTFEFAFDQKLSAQFNGVKNNAESTARVAIERPNKLSLRQKSSQPSVDIVSDGEHLSMSIAALKQYTQAAAPKTLDELFADPLVMGGAGGRGPLFDLFADDPYKSLMEGVTNEEYAGLEKIGDVEAHHLKLEQNEFDWELWVAVGERPLLLQAAFDMKKSLAAGGAGDEQLKNAQFNIVQHYTNWQFDKTPTADTFSFQPPAGAKKVDSFFGGEEPEVSPLVGKPAPDVEQELLDGGHFSLKEQKGKKIVILDFWATWCGPCVREMPIVAKVADEYREKGVALYCVNQREETDAIQKFLEEKKLNVTVSRDADGKAGNAYGVQGIPTLVLIDKAGVVQSVHVGFSPQIGEKLKQELDALLAGKDLAAEARRAREMADADLPTEALAQAWTKPGRYSSVAAAVDGKSIVAVKGQSAEFLSAAGETRRSINLAAPGGRLRCARLSGKTPGELLVFDLWAHDLTALDNEGGKLWSVPKGQGIDDVWAADLDGDEKDEVVVGHNGGTGLHVFNSDGQPRWKFTSIGNVWHVTAGDLDGDGAREVVSTSAAGKVHVFDAAGKELNTLDPGIYANMVRVARLPGEPADSLLVAGGGPAGVQMAAMSGEGVALWHADLPNGVKHCESMACAPGTTWAAVGCHGGLVCVIDIRTGEMIAAASHQGMTPDVAWIAADDGPLLLAATGSALTAWHVKR